MFEIELKSGKRKQKSPGLQQPLPVPIASLTWRKANDAIWWFYHGKLEPRFEDGCYWKSTRNWIC